MQSKQIKAVIFDMDGVIVDSEPRHEKAILEIVRELGYAENHGIRFADWIGRTDHEIWMDFIGRHKPSQSLAELLAMKRNRVMEIIRRERPLLDGLARFFPIIVTGSEVKRGKPAPDIFLRTAELLGLPPEHCVVIEDSKPGVAAGIAAGMTVFAITNTHPPEQLRQATHVVSTYDEIQSLLLRP